MICKHAKISSKMRGKTAPKRGVMTPDAWNFSRNAKLNTWNGLQLYKACIICTWDEKTEARQPLEKHFYSSKYGPIVSTNMAKLACKNGPKHEVKTQLTAADPKKIRGLHKFWRGAKNMIYYSWWPSLNQYTSMLKMPCKIGPKGGQNTKYTKNSSNSQRPLMKHEYGVKIRLFSVL